MTRQPWHASLETFIDDMQRAVDLMNEANDRFMADMNTLYRKQSKKKQPVKAHRRPTRQKRPK